jgi:phosphatidylethanolamine-binding protein (PEBP) family uncharacterized protein
MSIAPPPAAQFLNVGAQQPDYAVVLDHIPAQASYAVLICNDFDTPGCRSRFARSVGEVTDSFLKELLEAGVSLESLHDQSCPFVHLLACDVPVHGPHQKLPLSQIEKTGVCGMNTGGRVGFYPPSPPAGDPAVHRYQLRVVLLNQPLGLQEGFSAGELDLALRHLNPSWLVGECQAEMQLTAAQLRQQRG